MSGDYSTPPKSEGTDEEKAAYEVCLRTTNMMIQSGYIDNYLGLAVQRTRLHEKWISKLGNKSYSLCETESFQRR